jgi:hypothetical protein
MVTVMPKTASTNGYDMVDIPGGRDLSLKIEAEAIAEFDRLKELVDEIRQAQKGIPECDEYVKMVSGEPYVALKPKGNGLGDKEANKLAVLVNCRDIVIE